jgi:hypothetical protein
MDESFKSQISGLLFKLKYRESLSSIEKSILISVDILIS